jgi:hypothetical protein
MICVSRMNSTVGSISCVEVAEHIHSNYVETFLDSLVRHSDTIAMSATPPGQGGEGHFNEQPRSYWIVKLDTRGYRLHEEWTDELRAVKEFYSDNMMVFTRLRASVTNTYSCHLAEKCPIKVYWPAQKPQNPALLRSPQPSLVLARLAPKPSLHEPV